MNAVRWVAEPRAFPCRSLPLRVVAFAMALAAAGVSATEPSEPAADGSFEPADRAARFHELAESVSHHPVWQLALLERAYGVLADANQTGTAQALYARMWLAALLKLGLTGEAVSAYESVPESVRESTLKFEGTVFPIRWLPGTDSIDLRLEFAAACVLEGRMELAKQIVAAVAAELATSGPLNGRTDIQNVASPPSDSTNEEHWQPPDLGEHGSRLAILRRKLEPSDADPFGLLVGVAMSLRNDSWSPSVTWRRLLASLAEQEGYPSMARYHHRNAGFGLNAKWWNPDRVAEAAKTPEVIAAVSKATSAVDRLRVSLEALEQRVDPPPDDPASRVDETIGRLVAAPSFLGLREQPLPDGITPVTPALTWEQELEHSSALLREYNLPTGYRIVRVERRGSTVVALGASYDYDPVHPSLSSHGAYWVFRSRDGGVNWGPPLYTGLRTLMPYVAVYQSRLPMIGRSALRLEVKVREGDPDYIFFPGGYTSYKREEDGLFVELPWELLERDSDGDGLTDLAEERLLTDPLDPDTDRDGLNDGNDPLPHVVDSDAAASRAALMRAILEQTDGGPRGIVDEKTEFLVATRADFRGVQPVRRTIVLSPEEHAASLTKFGTFFPTRLTVAINRNGNVAFAVWSAGWHGGSAIFEKSGKQWVSHRVSTWIT